MDEVDYAETFLTGDTPTEGFLSKSDNLIYKKHLQEYDSICAHCKFWDPFQAAPTYGRYTEASKDSFRKVAPKLLFNLIKNDEIAIVIHLSSLL